jgi:hypothetical protein
MRNRSIQLLILSLTLLSPMGLSGCTSISSTPLTRSDDNSFMGDSNGKTRVLNRSRPYKGTPVKVKVQTHVDVFVDETYYLKREGETWSEHRIPNRLYSIRTAPVVSEQIIMVDFKRPASGTLKLGVEFNDQQYFKSIESKLVDTTLKDTAELIGQAVKTFSPKDLMKSACPETKPNIEFVEMKRTVAYQRFDVNAQNHEAQLEHFMNEYLNNCNSCGTSPSYDALLLPTVIGG